MNYQVLLKGDVKISNLSLRELETALAFTYLPVLDVLDLDEKEAILSQGLQHLKENEIAPEVLETGAKYKKFIESAYTAKVSVRFVSDEVGYGLFAEEDLQEGAYVGEYVGLIRKNNDYGQFNHYLYSYPVLDYIGRNYVIDATKGNLIRFANHSFTPNLKPCYAYFSGFYHCILIALKPILKGTQLTYNYGKKYWYVRGKPIDL